LRARRRAYLRAPVVPADGARDVLIALEQIADDGVGQLYRVHEHVPIMTIWSPPPRRARTCGRAYDPVSGLHDEVDIGPDDDADSASACGHRPRRWPLPTAAQRTQEPVMTLVEVRSETETETEASTKSPAL
jgi:hypothetical protein